MTGSRWDEKACLAQGTLVRTRKVLPVHAKDFRGVGGFKLENLDSATGKSVKITEIKITEHNI